MISHNGAITAGCMSEASPRTASAASSATAWGFLTPGLVLIGLSVLIPAAMALVMSFTQSGLDVSEPLRFVGLANIRRLLADPMFFKVLGTTLLYLVGVVPPVVLGSLGLAVLVNRQLPGIHWFRAAFYTPGWCRSWWRRSPFVGSTPKPA